MPTLETLTVDVETKTSKFSTGLKVITGGLAALAGGAAYAFAQFQESEKIMHQTNAVLESTNHAARVSADGIKSMAGRLAALTGVDDETIQSGENLLLTFTNIKNKVGGEFTGTFDRATGVMLDMSVAMGQDMKSSAIQIGKALNDPIKGLTSLTRVGVQFDDQTKKQIATMVKHGEVTQAQGLILDELTKEFGGSAEAQATATGKMQVALGNLAETVGKLVAPVFRDLAQGLTQLIGFLQDNAGPAFKAAVEWLKGVWNAVKPVAEILARDFLNAMKGVWNALQANVLPALKNLWQALEPILKIVGAVVVVVLDLAIRALPIIAKAIGIAVDALALWLKAWEAVIGWVKDHVVEPIANVLGKVIDWIGKVIDHIKGPFTAAWNGLTDVFSGIVAVGKGLFNGLIGLMNDVVMGINAIIRGYNAIPLAPNIPTIPHIPTLAAGGVVTKPTLAMIGDAGPEAVVPLNSGFGSINITVNGWVGDEAALTAKIRDALIRSGRRNAGKVLGGLA